MSLRRRWGCLAASIVALCASLVLAGCSTPDDGTELHFADEALASSASLTEEDRARVDTSWREFLELHQIYLKAGQAGVYDWNTDETKRPMYPYAGGRYMAALENDLAQLQERGRIRTGESKLTMRNVVAVSATSLTIEVCVDDSGTDTIDKTTRKSVAVPGQNKKYPVTLRAGLYADGRWRWVESVTARSMSC
jgi:hypothetical protein